MSAAVGWRGRAVRWWALVGGVLLAFGGAVRADPLHDYVAKPDPTYRCERLDEVASGEELITRYALTSQTWHGVEWRHNLVVVSPRSATPAGPTFVHITGASDGGREIGFLTALARGAGVPAAVITQVPNQPLFDGRKEDDLISFTFQRYLETGDVSWPAIFPMVKSVVRGLDCLAGARSTRGSEPARFILSGSSKRGWTTWLSGVVDRRVMAIAPKVFDMLNMKAQTDLAKRSYGGQSEKIRDYTEKGLVAAIDHPRLQELRRWVDPYEYRTRLTLPKFILLGTNDPYWVVDSLSEYWHELAGPKFVYQSANTGHSLGGNANENLVSWVGLLAADKPIPKLEWRLAETATRAIVLEPSVEPRQVTLWSTCAPSRDFRKAVWVSRAVVAPLVGGKIVVPLPRSGDPLPFCAFMAETEFALEAGRVLHLSTEAFVLPRE